MGVKQTVCMPYRCGMVMNIVVTVGKKQHWLMFHLLPSNKSAISRNHNPHWMTAGEESGQACNHVLEQEFKIESVTIYPASNLLYSGAVT